MGHAALAHQGATKRYCAPKKPRRRARKKRVSSNTQEPGYRGDRHFDQVQIIVVPACRENFMKAALIRNQHNYHRFYGQDKYGSDIAVFSLNRSIKPKFREYLKHKGIKAVHKCRKRYVVSDDMQSGIPFVL